MSHTRFTTPNGQDMVLLPLAEYQALINAADASEHSRAMAAIAAGAETLTTEEVAAALDCPTPLAFWRRKRGLTQKGLATRVGITQSYLSELESGAKRGEPTPFLRLARALNLRMEDLVV